ncbi:MAG: ABC transporter ATP-binding protein/permease [Acidimicrobiia bacterium]|nr:ABC transporter ATP-binding protein/permease [Acidimicrobiia bacterium]
MFITVSVPLVVRGTIDSALDEQTADLTPYIVTLLALAAALFVLRATYRYLLFTTAYGVETDLRDLVYSQLTRLSFSFYDRTPSGELISRANSDIRSVQVLLAFGPLAILSAFTFVFALVLMLSIHVGLTLVAVATMPLVYIVGLRMRERIFPLMWITQARMAGVATVVDENINGTRVVKAFAAEKAEVDKLADSAQRLRWAAVATVDARARFSPIIEALPRIGVAGILLYGGWLVIEGDLTIGTIVAFNSYVIMITVPFRLMGFLMMQTQRAAASSARIYEILDTRPDIVDRAGAVDLIDPAGHIEFRDVHFQYPASVGGDDSRPAVLEGFSLTVSAGETLAIVGRTGSGKSTIIRLLPRFYDIDAGAVCLDGHDVRDLTVSSLRHHVGVVFDEPFLFSRSIGANIAFARPDATDAEIEAAARAAQAHDFIKELSDGYDTVVGERGYTLSGGQRQRIAIARTLLANPRVLVLDDATSAIDVQVEEEIHRALETLLADRTTILIAHRLSTIALADRVALVDDGAVVALGTHEYLMAAEPRYRDVLATVADEEQS